MKHSILSLFFFILGIFFTSFAQANEAVPLAVKAYFGLTVNGFYWENASYYREEYKTPEAFWQKFCLLNPKYTKRCTKEEARKLPTGKTWYFPAIPETAGKTLVKKPEVKKVIISHSLPATVIAQKIDTYLKKRRVPLAGYGEKFVIAAQKHGIDPYLLPAISLQESNGGKNIQVNCHNPFGWGSGKICFKSFEEAIETVARNIGGNNPNTQHYYKKKSLKERLYHYNSVNTNYRRSVLAFMENFQKQECDDKIQNQKTR